MRVGIEFVVVQMVWQRHTQGGLSQGIHTPAGSGLVHFQSDFNLPPFPKSLLGFNKILSQ